MKTTCSHSESKNDSIAHSYFNTRKTTVSNIGTRQRKEGETAKKRTEKRKTEKRETGTKR